MKSTHGFSLIELMTVLSIVTIISIISITGLQFFWRKTQTDVLSSELVHAIYFARNEAVTRQERVILCGSTDQKNCSEKWQTGFIIKTEDDVIYHFQNVSQTGVLHWRSFRNKQDIEFLATGFAHSQNGSFWYCMPEAVDAAWAVVLNKSGRVRVAYPDKDGKVLDDKRIPFGCQQTLQS